MTRRHAGCRKTRKTIAAICGLPHKPVYTLAAAADAEPATANRGGYMSACYKFRIHRLKDGKFVGGLID